MTDWAWPIAGGVAGAAAAGGFCYACFHPRAQLFARTCYRGPRDDPPRIALSFDDGPHPEATPAILDALATHDVKAAFFVIGRNAAQHPALLRRIDAEGHLIGNHSFDHAYHGMCRFVRYWDDQLSRTDAVVADAIGRRPRLFRPPMGFKQPCIGRALRHRGGRMVTWTRRGLDGVPTDTAAILKRLIEPTRPGDILTLHDGLDPHSQRHLQATIDAIDPLAAGLLARGFTWQRLDTFIGEPAYHAA